MGANITGEVNLSGCVTVAQNTTLITSQAWYNRGAGVAADGHGLINSTTAEANFLKASPSFNVPPGTTP